MDELKLDQPISIEEFKTAIKKLIKTDQANLFYLRKLKELYPEVDATE